MLQLKQNKKELLVLGIVLILSLGSVLPLFRHGFFVSDDGEWMIIRFSAFHQAFVHGQFPVRLLPRLNFEYGYPVANFLYPGFMYLAELFHLLKFGFVVSVKIILGLAMIGSAIFSYLWLKKLFDKWGGFAGALVYLYSSYHLYDIYQRGSVGEVLALAVVPYILWSVEKRSKLLAAIGIGLLILSHNTLAALFLPILFIYSLFRKDIKFYIPTFLLGIGMATFFWLPALYDLQYTIFSQIKVSDWQTYFANVNLIGWLNISVYIVALTILIIKIMRPKTNILLQKKENVSIKIFLIFFSFGLVSLFFSSQWSRIFWQFLPISFIQFPFRLLSVTILASAFLSAYIVSVLRGRYLQIGFILLLGLFTIIDVYPHFKAIQFTDKGEGFYSTNEDTTTVKNEYMPKWVKVLPSQRPTSIVEAKNATISNIVNKTNMVTFSSDAKQAADVTINMIYFPGWQAKVDNNPVPILYSNSRGLISFSLLQGSHQVAIKFGETPIRLFSDMLSVTSIFIILLCVIPSPFRRRLG